MSKRSSELPIADMLEAAEKIENFISGISENQFYSDEKTSDAVVRNLEIIGEAANRLSEEFKLKNTVFDWMKIVGLRHRIVHDYFGIDLQIIWHILQKDLPVLKPVLKKLSEMSL